MSRTSAKERGWKLVRDTLDDEEAYLTLRQGLPIQLRGSEGTLYILYPSGRFVKVGTKNPELGKMVAGSKYVSTDYLATIIAWIKHDENNLEENWRCGNFEVEEPTPRLERHRSVMEPVHIEDHLMRNTLLIIMLTIAPIVVIPMLVIPNLNFVPESTTVEDATAETSNLTSIQTPFFEATQTVTSLLPIIAIVVMLLAIITRFGTTRW